MSTFLLHIQLVPNSVLCGMHLHLFFVFLVIATVNGEDDCPTSDKSHLAPVRLRRHLLCDYDKNSRPIRDHKAAVPFMIQLILKYYDYNMHDNSFTIDSWMAMGWTDEHLTWNPDEYESLTRVHLSNTEIWTPDLSVYNRRNQGGDPSAVETATCIVDNKGGVVCVPSTSHTTICTSDLSKFPFDTHNCTVRFGSWVHSGEELNIQIPAQPVSTADLVPNGEWDLVDTYAIKHPGKFKCCPNNTYPSINFSFKVQRRSGGHTASVILPTIALIILTLTSLWIAPDNPNRLPMCYVNLICEFLHVQYVAWMVPMNGDRIPLILLFARDSLLLCSFTIIFSLFLKKMIESDKPAPGWISRILCVLVAFKPGQIAFLGNSSFKGLSEQGDDDVAAIINNPDLTSRKTEWLLFAKILDRLLLVIYIIVYVCMFIAFTP